MKKLLLLLTILSFNSCSLFKESGIEMKIKNDANKPIINVEFSTTEKLESIKIDRIESKDSVIEFLSMRKNKTDGAYKLSFTRANGKKEESSSGYYSNGNPLHHQVDFSIKMTL